jgi:hypothetical protein
MVVQQGHPNFANLRITGCGSAGQWAVRCVISNSCGSVTTDPVLVTFCPGDYDCSGAFTVQDIFAMLAAYFRGDSTADVNDSGTISVQDIYDFLAAYFSKCE